MTGVSAVGENQDPWVEELLRQRIFVVLAPHPDDEAIGAAILMHRVLQAGARVTVIFLTEGIPREERRSESNRHRNGDFATYRATRLRESERAMACLPGVQVRRYPFFSRELADRAEEVFNRLNDESAMVKRPVLLLPAYEAAHPDHDITHVIGATLARRHRLRAVEYAGYNRTAAGNQYQRFLERSRVLVYSLAPTESEVGLKHQMLQSYSSQQESVLHHFRSDHEAFRDLPTYDYRMPPPCDVPVYETWGSGVTGSVVQAAIINFLRIHDATKASLDTR